METVERDFAPKGVKFYYIYKALAHPETNSYVAPFTQDERLMHVKEAERAIGSRFQWLCDTIDYSPGSSDIPVSAAEVNSRQVGVCRDLAHLGIALCRSLSIPARMVVGYLHQLEPMDLHAWFEAYVGRRWYTFDATQADLKGGYVAVGYGRDAADVAVFNQFGPAVYPTAQTVDVERFRG